MNGLDNAPAPNDPSPLGLIKASILAVPAMKYALSVAGFAAVASIALGLLGSPTAAVIGVLVALSGSVLVVVFANLARLNPATFLGPARLIMWAMTLLFVGSLVLLFTSFFFGKPLPLQPAANVAPAPSSPPAPVSLSSPARRSDDPGTSVTVIAPAAGAVAASPDMVRIASADITLGIVNRAAFLEWCVSHGANSAQCGELADRSVSRTVHVPSFLIDRNEITREAFANWLNETLADKRAELADGRVFVTDGHALLAIPACYGVGGLSARGGRVSLDSATTTGRAAATCVTWHAARAFCRARGKRLPTDAEWELAAGGSEKRAFPWRGAGPLQCEEAVFGRVPKGQCASAQQGPDDIDAFAKDVTPEGVRSLGGNVSEWVDASGAKPEFQVARGGSWGGPLVDMHPAKSMLLDPSTAVTTVGFRCASSLDRNEAHAAVAP